MADKNWTTRNALFALLLIYGLAMPALADQGNISLTFDLSAAEAVLALFDQDEVPREQVEALLEIPAVRATISQTARFDDSATEEAYVESLWSILRDQSPASDPFKFENVRARLDGVRRAVRLISAQEGALEAQIGQRVGLYLPPDVDIETTLFAVLGGTSDGWAPGNGNFYVALRYFQDDVPGLTAMVAHEVYHVAQGHFFNDSRDPTQTAAARRLLRILLFEGTATLVGNPQDFEGNGKYLTFLQEKHRRNLARIRDNFSLFETLYFRAMKDPEVRFGELYGLGFSGEWDSPLYFVGFSIAAGIEKHQGREALVEMLANNTGAELLTEYIHLYSSDRDPDLVRFSPTIEALLRNAQ